MDFQPIIRYPSRGQAPKIFAMRLNNESAKAIEYFEIANHVSKTQTGTFDAECFYKIAVEYIKLNKLAEALSTLEELIKEIPKQNQFYQKAAKCFYKIALAQQKSQDLTAAINTLHRLLTIYPKENSYYAKAKKLQQAITIEKQVNSQNEISKFANINSRFERSLNIGSSQSNYRSIFLPLFPYQEKPRQPEWKVIEKKADELLKAKKYNAALSHYAALLNEYATCMDNATQAKWHYRCGLCKFYQDDFVTALQSFKTAKSLDDTNTIYSETIETTMGKINSNQRSYKYAYPYM